MFYFTPKSPKGDFKILRRSPPWGGWGVKSYKWTELRPSKASVKF
jgi:hypothetical protein